MIKTQHKIQFSVCNHAWGECFGIFPFIVVNEKFLMILMLPIGFPAKIGTPTTRLTVFKLLLKAENFWINRKKYFLKKEIKI